MQTATAPPAAPLATGQQALRTPQVASQGVSTPDVAGNIVGPDAGSVAGPGTGRIAISPRARKLAERKGIKFEELNGSGPGGRIIERDLLQVLERKQPLTPAALASQKGVSPADGSRIGGRVGLKDLAEAAGAAHGTAPGAVPGAGSGATPVAVPGAAAAIETGFPGPVTETPLSGIRRLIAGRMLASLQGSAQYTLHGSALAEAMLDYRQRIKTAPEELGLGPVTLDKMVVYAVSRLLPRHSGLNSHFLSDEGKIVRFERVHLGYAVDTPRGLMVPVIRNADLLSLKQIALEARRLQKACLEGSIAPDELNGSTFTVTNLGVLGVERFTPVLTTPEVGILGVGGLQLKPVQEEGQVRFKQFLSLSLTANHQIVDGAPAARFLQDLAGLLAGFDLLLAE